MQVHVFIPIFRIFDVTKAREFYLDFLGFQFDWENRFDETSPLYMQVSLGHCFLHLSEHHGDCTPGASMRVEVKGLDDYCKELQSKTYRFYNPSVETMSWGTRDMKVIDPFGNSIIFTEAG